jgi:hypothetical protein
MTVDVEFFMTQGHIVGLHDHCDSSANRCLAKVHALLVDRLCLPPMDQLIIGGNEPRVPDAGPPIGWFDDYIGKKFDMHALLLDDAFTRQCCC